jgi:hypothetical protein
VPVVVTTLEQLTEHGADAAAWHRLGRCAAAPHPAGTPAPWPTSGSDETDIGFRS